MKGECLCSSLTMGHSPVGYENSQFFTCNCGQKWWQHNASLHLWSTVDDAETITNIKSGCRRPVSIGNPSMNLRY